MDKLQEIQIHEAKISRLQTIVGDLEHSVGYKYLLELIQEEIKILDDTWQWIDEPDVKKRMEARATKMAYMHLVNLLDIVKDDLNRNIKVIEEIKSTELDS